MKDIELSEKDIKEAKEKKRCPFCKCKHFQGNDFLATFDLAGQYFWFDEKGNIEWGERNRDNIETVECNVCGEEIPSEIWKEWFRGTAEE